MNELDYREVTDLLDVMFRRWPERIELLAEALPAIYSNEDGYSLLLVKMSGNPPWRSRLIASLTADSVANLHLGVRLLQDLAVGNSPPTATETAQVLSSLFRREEYNTAYRTFLLTLSPAEKDLSGFVFNGTFQQGPSARVFDWNLQQQPGVTVSLPQNTADTGFNPSGSGLALEFNETPVLGVGVEQYLLLSPRRLPDRVSGLCLCCQTAQKADMERKVPQFRHATSEH